MSARAPTVSVALPVYNGAKFLAQAIESTLKQGFGDLELIICDNASSDSTEKIGRAYAATDSRVRYLRNARNLGAAPNFNRAFQLSRGKYFRWAAHDDLVEPSYIERCVEVLDRDDEVVLCHSQVRLIGPDDSSLGNYVYLPATSSPDPRRRFFDLLFVKNHCYEVFGLIRSETLRHTRLIGSHPVGDRVLLAELALRGRFYEVPERLFLSRDHPQRSVRRLRSQRERAPWFDAQLQGRITLPEWRALFEYWQAVRRAPLPARDSWTCQLYMLKWLRHYRKRMREDLAVAVWKLATLPYVTATRSGLPRQ